MMMGVVRADRALAAADARPLQLEVYVNDADARLIGTFTQLSDRRIAATRGELTELGIAVPGAGAADEIVAVDGLKGIRYRYDEPAQKIFFQLDDAARVRRNYDARAAGERVGAPRSDWGAVMNYTLFASSMKALDHTGFTFSGANASLDSRVFGPYGTLSQTGIVGTTLFKTADALRLDTTWTYSDPENMMSYRAGDMISGSLPWTRSIRMGGFQLQRNFALRPDLVTLPLPAVSGSAAVPSTVDVYINNLKTYSQDVAAGPYQITNLPMLTGAGTARIVVHDSAGREVQTTLPFYATPKLLREGLWDFSAEAGFARHAYGIESAAYGSDPVGSGSARRGVFDWLTIEAHGEGGAGLYNGGLGAIAQLGTFGTLSVAGSASRFGSATGFQAYAAFDAQFWGLGFHGSMQHTFGLYNDLASATARALPPLSAPPVDILASYLASVRPAKYLDTVSVSVPLPFDRSSFSVSFLHIELAEGTRSDILNLSYSRPLWNGASLFVNAFADLRDRKSMGVFAGLSIPLGRETSASVGVTRTREGTNVIGEVSKPLTQEPGSYGWRVRDAEGATPYRAAEGSYRAPAVRLDGLVQQTGNQLSGSLQAQGGIAMMGGGVFFSDRIDDAFAIVDAGAANVDVLYENRPVGKTNAQGKLLLPSLRSFESNRISIDAGGLPVNADAPVTQNFAAPGDRGGVVVSFGIKTEPRAAVLILKHPNGKFVDAGASGRLEGSEEPFAIGYDGRAFVKGLGASNTVVVTTERGECRATFPYVPQENTQVVVGPVVCQ
jgi:outer membrane usher protein